VAAHTQNPAHEGRLLAAMADLVAERGYPAVTVGDVVGRARVSKRTFYQHFPDREACFLAVYATAAEAPMQRIAAVAADPAVRAGGLAAFVRTAVRAYLGAMSEQPVLTRTLLTEISSVGPRGWQVRRDVLGRFADQIVLLIDAGRAQEPGLSTLPRPLALALVGGINELVLEAVEAGRAEHLLELESTATTLVVAVLTRGD
jgi:AcrR family transcriptional regulator